MKAMVVSALLIVLVLVVAVAAYSVGQSNGLTEAQNIRTQFFQSRPSSGTAQDTTGQTGTAARSQAGRPLASGTVKSIQGDMLELSQQDGSTVTVALGKQTVVEKMVTGAASDLQVGQRVSVQGVQATGQVNAQVIQITAGTQ